MSTFYCVETGPDRTRIKLVKNGIGAVINLNTTEVVEKKYEITELKPVDVNHNEYYRFQYKRFFLLKL